MQLFKSLVCLGLMVTLVSAVSADEETTGLDRIEHGETGFDLGLALESVGLPINTTPRSALIPPNGVQHFSIDIEGVNSKELAKVWNGLCQPTKDTHPAFKEIYPHMTTVKGNRFNFRSGESAAIRPLLEKLLKDHLSVPVKANIVNN